MAEPRPRRPRIADVAEAAGVSKTAVSFAFNSPARLSSSTVARIRGVADQLGYQPHPVARMLGSRQTGTIGVLTPQELGVVFENPFFWTFCQGVGRVADEVGFALQVISPVDGSLAGAVARASVDGFVAIGLSADHPEVARIPLAGLPIVLVDSSALSDLPSIDVDDEGGARAAAAHLVRLGHRDFLVIGVEPPHPAGRDDPEGVLNRRLRGYRAVLGEAGIELPPEAIVAGPASIAGGVAAFGRAWEDGLRPTAVLAMSDAMAVGAMRAIRDQRLAIPGDVSVVGFDDLEVAQFTDPPLTTVHQPVRQKGEEAIRLLLAIIGGSEERPQHRRLETRLIVRASTGSAPDNRRR